MLAWRHLAANCNQQFSRTGGEVLNAWAQIIGGVFYLLSPPPPPPLPPPPQLLLVLLFVLLIPHLLLPPLKAMRSERKNG